MRAAGIDVVALLSTINETNGRVAMHGTRRELLQAQAAAVGLPVWEVNLPDPCPNDEYERRMLQAVERAEEAGVTHVAFGDVFLEDVRAYREEMLRPTGLDPLFPIWLGSEDTIGLATRDVGGRGPGRHHMRRCHQMDPRCAGRPWDPSVPAGVDPVGERRVPPSAGRARCCPPHPVPGAVIEQDGTVGRPTGRLTAPKAPSPMAARCRRDRWKTVKTAVAAVVTRCRRRLGEAGRDRILDRFGATWPT